MTKSSDIMLEHFVMVDDINDEGEIVATKAMTLVKEAQAFQIPGFGINGNLSCMEGADKSKLYIRLDHFDVYGKVVNQELIDIFNNFILNLLQNKPEQKRVILA